MNALATWINKHILCPLLGHNVFQVNRELGFTDPYDSGKMIPFGNPICRHCKQDFVEDFQFYLTYPYYSRAERFERNRQLLYVETL